MATETETPTNNPNPHGDRYVPEHMRARNSAYAGFLKKKSTRCFILLVSVAICSLVQNLGIINIGSISSELPTVGSYAYAPSKSYV